MVILVLNFHSNPVRDTVRSTYNTYISHHHEVHGSPERSLLDKELAEGVEAELNFLVASISPEPPRFPHLSALCTNTTFTPGLYLQCHSGGGPHFNAVNGGLSNAWNRYSSCMRLAIDAGANLILAPLMQRDDEEIWNTNWRQVGPETMIDVEDLTKNLGEACPAMTVRGCTEGSCDEGESGMVVKAPRHAHRDGSWTTGRFKEMVDTAIVEGTNSTMSREDVDEESTMKVKFGDSFLSWNYTATSGSALKKEVFQVLHFAPDLLELGKKVQAAAKAATQGHDIIGIHFRSEEDWPSEVCNASAQIDMYSKELTKWNKFRLWKWKLQHIYLSCGDLEKVEMFRQAMAPLGFKVHDKHSLLTTTDPDTLQKIEDLNFDQRAVVEYVNLKGAERFLGLLPSTLSYLVAYERTLNKTFDAPFDAKMATDAQLQSAGKGRKWQMVAEPKGKVGWFEKYILAGSWRGEGLSKHWPEPIQMRGDAKTRLLVVDGQSELSDAFP